MSLIRHIHRSVGRGHQDFVYNGIALCGAGAKARTEWEQSVSDRDEDVTAGTANASLRSGRKHNHDRLCAPR
jgi:hypothetical protein